MSKQKKSRAKRIGLLLTMVMVFTMVAGTATPAMAAGTYNKGVFNEPVQLWGYRVRINTSTAYINNEEQGGTISNNKNKTYLKTQGSWKFTANPKTGYVFDGWTINAGDSDAFNISGNSITISYEGNQNYTATANFHEVPKYTLTTSVPNSHGSISKSPDQSEYTEGTSVQLTANPETGYRFKQWSADASGTDNPITIEMNSNKSVEAVFEPLPTYTLDVGINPAGSGSVSKDPDVSSYWEGRDVTLTPSAASGYRFGSWSGDASGSANPLTLSMNGNKSITANFIKTYTVTLHAGDHGHFDHESAVEGTHDENSTINLNDAGPDPNSALWLFYGWKDDSTGQFLSSPTFTLTGDRSFTAVFNEKDYLAVKAEDHGSLANNISGHYAQGTKINLNDSQPTGDPGYTLDYWKEFGTWYSGSGTEVPLDGSNQPVITIGDCNYFKAFFKVADYPITYILNSGSVSGNPATYRYFDSAFTLNNPTKTGYTFAGWTGTDLTGPTMTVTIPNHSSGARTYTATWTAVSYDITYDLDGGAVSPENPTSYDIEDDSFTLNNPTKEGYEFTGWSGTGITGTSKSVTIPKGSTGDKQYTAHWALADYSISYELNGGTVSPANPTSYTIESSVITLKNPTKTGYTFAGWTGTDLTGPTVNVTIPTGSTGDRSYTATWTANTYTVVYNANTGTGNMAPSTHTYDVSKDLRDNAFTKEGCTFAGWAKTSTGIAVYTDGQSVSNLAKDDGATVTLYAKWSVSNVTVIGYDDVYDGNGHGVTVSGTLPGDTVTYSTDGGSTHSSTPPSFTNATSGVTVYVKVERAGAADYIGSAEVKISKAELTVTANNETVIYGDTSPAYTVSYSGFVFGEDENDLGGTLDFDCTYAAGSPVSGSPYTITPKGLMSGNYDITFADGTLTVDKATLTVEADDKAVTYGDTAPTYTASYTGFVGSDNESALSGDPSLTCSYVKGNGAGSYTIMANQGTLAADNYSFSFADGTLTVDKATLTVEADDKTVTYGDTAPTYTASYTGFVGSDNENVLSGDPLLTCPYVQGNGSGSYTITADQGTLVADNYTFSFSSGTLTVNKATLIVDADDKVVTYGDAAPTYTASYTGFLGSDNESVLSGDPSFTCSYVKGNGAGSYTITVDQGTLTADNYTFSFTDGTLTVDKATLTVKPETKYTTYGSSAPSNTVMYSGFKGSDDKSVLSGSPKLTCSYTKGDGAGKYTIEVTQKTLDAANYDFSLSDGLLYVRKASLTITADNKAVAYGDAAPTYTATYSGFKDKDDKSDLSGTLVFDCSYAAGSPASGSPYSITPSGLSSRDYRIYYVPGALTVSAPAGSTTVSAGPTPSQSPTPSPSPSVSPSPEPSSSPEASVTPSPEGNGGTETIGDEDVPMGSANAKGTGFFSHWWSWMILAGILILLLLLLLFLLSRKKKQEKH